MKRTKPEDSSRVFQLAYSKVGPILLALEKAGFTPEILARFQSDQQYADRHREVIESAGIRELPVAEIELAEHLGTEYRYHGVRKWSSAFWVFLTEAQLTRFPQFPWPLEILDEPCPFSLGHGRCRDGRYIPIKETHAIFLGLDRIGTKILSAHKMQRLVIAAKNRSWISVRPAGKAIGNSPFFESEHPAYRWYMVFQDKIRGSNQTGYEELLAKLPPEYENPSLTETFLCHFLCKDSRGYGPLSFMTGGFGLTSTVTEIPDHGQQRISLGKPTGSIEEVGLWHDDLDSKGDHLGIIASRIPGK